MRRVAGFIGVEVPEDQLKGEFERAPFADVDLERFLRSSVDPVLS